MGSTTCKNDEMGDINLYKLHKNIFGIGTIAS